MKFENSIYRRHFILLLNGFERYNLCFFFLFGCLVYCFFSVVVDAIVFVVGAHHIMATRYYYVITMKLCGPHWLRPLSSFDVRQRWSIHEKICIVFNVKRSTMRAMRIYSSMVMCQIWYVDFYEQKSGFALLISQLFGFSQFVPWNLLLCAVNIRQHGKYQEVEINTPKSQHRLVIRFGFNDLRWKTVEKSWNRQKFMK